MKRYITAFFFAMALWLALVGSVIHPVVVYATGTGGAGAGNPEFVPSLLFPDGNVSPDETGEMVFDNTVTGLTGGAIAWYNGSAIKYLIDLDTLPSNDDYVVAYDADNDKFYMKADSTSAGSVAFTDLTDTPATYTTENAVYTTNATPDGVSETTVVLTEGTNSFNIAQGTTAMDVAADIDIDTALTVNTEAVTLDQSLATTDAVTFDDITISNPSNIYTSLDFVPEDGVEVRTPSTMQSLAAGDSLTVTKAIMRVQGDGGAVTSTAAPFINASGIVDGQCVTIEGASDSNLLTINDESTTAGNNLQLAHSRAFTFGLGDAIKLCYNGTVSDWFERWRVDN